MVGGRSIGLPFLSAIRIHPFRDRVAMDPERGCCVCDPLFVARVGFLDVELLEFFERFIQHDVPVKHFFNYCFQARAYLHRWLCPYLLSEARASARATSNIPLSPIAHLALPNGRASAPRYNGSPTSNS